jgi:signal transduction histidine kinase
LNAGLLGKVCKSALLLDRMITDLTDMALLESGRFALRVSSHDVALLVEGVVSRHLFRAKVTGDFTLPPVNADPLRVEQILLNLLGNAAKYGGPEGVAGVNIARQGGAAIISVTNEGSAIPEDERSRVFDAYYRARGHQANTSGLGLGLYICRKLVEQHGGQIWTDGDASQTRFTFSLPFSGPPALARAGGQFGRG